MKLLRSLSMLALVTAAHAGPIAKDYQVSKAGKDQARLAEVFQKVAALEALAKPAGKNFEVLRRVDDKQFIVYRKATKFRPVVASGMARIGGGGGSATPTTYEETDYTTAFWLITSSPHNIADGEVLRGVVATITEETKSDAGSTYRVLRDTPAVPVAAFTKENFVFRLKAGQTWNLKNFESQKCPTCGGDGKLSAMQKNGACPDCRGKGAFPVDLTVRW